MTDKPDQPHPGLNRRRLLSHLGVAGLAGAAGIATGAGVRGRSGSSAVDPASSADAASGASQRLQLTDTAPTPTRGLPAGVINPVPAFGYLLAIDLTSSQAASPRQARTGTIDLLRNWTTIAAEFAEGSATAGPGAAGADLRPASVELSVGIGASLLQRCGLTDRRPAALVKLPPFQADQLEAQLSGGDLLIQVGAEDPMRLHSVVQALLASLGNTAQVRWSRSGFRHTHAATTEPGQTARNLMGHRDGTANPPLDSPLWHRVVTATEPAASGWMDGGSYAVVRTIVIDLDQWFGMEVAGRDRVIGRATSTGAALGHEQEDDPVELARRNADGQLAIDARAHIRLSNPQNVSGQRIYRRSWNFDDGIVDGQRRAGLVFIAWQGDPRSGFIPIQQSLDEGGDLLNRFITTIGGGVFAFPPTDPAQEFIGQPLFE